MSAESLLSEAKLYYSINVMVSCVSPLDQGQGDQGQSSGCVEPID